MAYEDYENEEETEDEEEKDESSESSENANAGNNTQAPVNTPAPTNNQPIDTAIKAGQEAQQPTAPAQQPATPAQTSTLPNDSPYGNGGQSSDSTSNNQPDVYTNFASEWAKAQTDDEKNALLTKYGVDKLQANDPEAVKYANAIKAAQASAPATPGTQALTSSYYNSINIDPNKTYGQVNSGRGYVYSYDAKQLQNDVNRAIFDYNKKIANGTIEGKTAADYIQPLKVDGMYGSKTKDAISKLQQAGYNVTNFPASVGGDYSNGNSGASQSGSSTSSDNSTAPNRPMTGNSMSAALANASQSSTANGATNGTGKGNGKAGKADNSGTDYDSLLQDKAKQREAAEQAWYEKEFEKYYGSPPNKDILDDQRIRAYVDEQRAKQGLNSATAESEINDEQLRLAALEKQAEEQARTDEINANRDAAFTPRLEKDLKGGKSIEQIVGEGDKSFNRWLEDNWDDLSYTYNLSGNPFGNGQNTEQRNPINYDALSDELFQMDRNDWYQRPETQQNTANNNAEQLALYDELENAYRNSVVGENGYTGQQQVEFDQMDRNDSYNPTWTMPNNTPATANQREPINYNAMSDELNQMDRNDWYQRPESQQTSGLEREPINYNAMADELAQLERNDWYQRPETPQAPERIPLEYSDAFIRQEEMKDAYSPYADYSGSMASDDVQSSGTTSPEEQDMLAAYEAAMQSAGRARDIFQGLPNEAEQIQQTREQWDQNMRTALENQFNNPYMQQFRTDFEQLKQQFPNYSDAALMDMVMVNEEMLNGQSSYYKWLANSL